MPPLHLGMMDDSDCDMQDETESVLSLQAKIQADACENEPAPMECEPCNAGEPLEDLVCPEDAAAAGGPQPVGEDGAPVLPVNTSGTPKRLQPASEFGNAAKRQKWSVWTPDNPSASGRASSGSGGPTLPLSLQPTARAPQAGLVRMKIGSKMPVVLVPPTTRSLKRRRLSPC